MSTEPRRSTRTRAREEAAQEAANTQTPEPSRDTPSKPPHKASLKRKRAAPVPKDSTPSTPAASTAPADDPEILEDEPPRLSLPIRLTDGEPLPTLPDPQAVDLNPDEYQTIQQSGVLSSSLQRSRAIWVSGTNFRLFHAHFVPPKKVADRTDVDKQNIQRQKEIVRNFPLIGTEAQLVIEPHTFPIRLYGPREAYRAPAKKPVQYGQWPNHSNQYSPYQQPQHQQHHQHQQQKPPQYHNAPAPYPTAPPPQQRPPPKPQPKPPTQSSNATSTPAPDPVIHMLAQRAGQDPELKNIMKIVASGNASPQQLSFFQRHITELTELLGRQKEAAEKAKAAKAAQAPQPQTPASVPQGPPAPHGPQVSQPFTASVAPHTPSIPKTASTPQATPVPQKTPAPQSAPVPQTQTTPAPQATPGGQTTPAPQAMPAAQMTPAPQAASAPQTTSIPQKTPAVQAPLTPQATPTPQATSAPQTAPVPPAVQAPPITPASQAVPTAQMTSASQPPPPAQVARTPSMPLASHASSVPQAPQQAPPPAVQHAPRPPSGPKAYHHPHNQQSHPPPPNSQQYTHPAPPHHGTHQTPYAQPYHPPHQTHQYPSHSSQQTPQPHQSHQSHNQYQQHHHASPYNQRPPPLPTTYRPLVFDFTEGNGDKFYFPSYSYMEWLPNHQGVKISFLITKMKPKAKSEKPETKESVPSTPAPKASTVPAAGPKQGQNPNTTQPTNPAPTPTPGAPDPSSSNVNSNGTPNQAPAASNGQAPQAQTPATPQPSIPQYVHPPRIEDFDEKSDIDDIEFFQPITCSIVTNNFDVLQSLPRAVRPVEAVEKYMDKVFDNCKRADETYLAFRLPKEGAPDAEGSDGKAKDGGERTPVVSTPVPDVVMGGTGASVDKKRGAGRPRKSLAT